MFVSFLSFLVLVVLQVYLHFLLTLSPRPLETINLNILCHLQIITLSILLNQLLTNAILLKPKLLLSFLVWRLRFTLYLREELIQRDFRLNFTFVITRVEILRFILLAHRHVVVVGCVDIASCLRSQFFTSF